MIFINLAYNLLKERNLIEILSAKTLLFINLGIANVLLLIESIFYLIPNLTDIALRNYLDPFSFFLYYYRMAFFMNTFVILGFIWYFNV